MTHKLEKLEFIKTPNKNYVFMYDHRYTTTPYSQHHLNGIDLKIHISARHCWFFIHIIQPARYLHFLYMEINLGFQYMTNFTYLSRVYMLNNQHISWWFALMLFCPHIQRNPYWTKIDSCTVVHPNHCINTGLISSNQWYKMTDTSPW